MNSISDFAGSVPEDGGGLHRLSHEFLMALVQEN